MTLFQNNSGSTQEPCVDSDRSCGAESATARVTGDIYSGVAAADLPVPMLMHEAMDARTFPRLESNLQAFEGGMLKAGVWLNSSIARMRALGLLGEASRWALASERAYNMFMKAFLEGYRLDPAVSGYEVRRLSLL